MKIAREEFPIPKLPPPEPLSLPDVDSEGRLVSPLPSSPAEPSSQDVARENSASNVQHVEPGQLPRQLEDMLAGITNHLRSFEHSPPHTIQRLSELILRPRAHYKAVATYLHAVDRVVMVTSSTDAYPLPPPDLGDASAVADPANSVAWSNPTSGSLGTDEALGGALLTPIPWVHSNRESPEPTSPAPGEQAQAAAQIHSESTEKIDGPNGMGSIETVSVSVNGVHSTGHARGVTQGELLRQEQRAGVVPVNQLTRSQENHSHDGERRRYAEAQAAAAAQHQQNHPEEQDQMDHAGDVEGGNADDEPGQVGGEGEEEEEPHARGPEEIGVGDTGLQSVTTSFVGDAGLETQGIDLEAAVGRKHDDDDGVEEAGPAPAAAVLSPGSPSSPAVEASGTKREAEPGLESEPAKKVKEDDDEEMATDR